MHMPQDKWELLLPDNFATPESVGCGMELLGDNTCGGGHRGSTDGLHGKDGEMPTMRRFRKHAGSLGASEHAYDGERGAVQRLRQKAVHSQFAMADGAVSFAGSRAGSATGSVDALHAALTAQHRTFAGVGHSGHSGRLQSSFSTGKVRRSADITERSVGSFPHIHMLSNATPQPSRHGRLPSEAQNSPSMQRHIPPGALTATARASMEHRGHGSYSRAAVADTDNGVQKIQEGEGDGEQATLAASVSTGVGLRDKGSGRQGSGETGGSGPRQKVSRRLVGTVRIAGRERRNRYTSVVDLVGFGFRGL